ncbi:MAG TPA: class II aldolase/adducin family protein [Acetobacteraceae bacterium]|jgi:ribulose-5-phosphate 4-epimerase/fuculose-1-phosphate aldolase|nr:class II aldolase/adducin family protein [Acetobacteraceae bacterium]
MNDLSNPPVAADEEHALRQDLAATFRLSARFKLNVGIGNHFSLMMPGSKDRFLVNARGLLFQEITASNLLVVDFAGTVHSGGREVRAVTYHIHAPIHDRHPAARCVLHVHPPNLTALSIIEDGRLALAHHDNLIVNDRVAYDDAATGPASELAEGYRLADVIGDKTILVMANHGVLVVGPTVHDAFSELVTVEHACGVQLHAMWTGAKLRQQPDHLRWNHRGVWSEKVDGRLYLDAWRRILDREEPDYAD